MIKRLIKAFFYIIEFIKSLYFIFIVLHVEFSLNRLVIDISKLYIAVSIIIYVLSCVYASINVISCLLENFSKTTGDIDVI